MNDEEAFQAWLDAHPDDHTARLVFADWLQDRDDPRAAGYRALGEGKLWVRPHRGEYRRRKFLTWFCRARQADETYHQHSLSFGWFSHLKGGEQRMDDGYVVEPDEGTYGDWTDYPNRRKAENAAALAYVEYAKELTRAQV